MKKKKKKKTLSRASKINAQKREREGRFLLSFDSFFRDKKGERERKGI